MSGNPQWGWYRRGVEWKGNWDLEKSQSPASSLYAHNLILHGNNQIDRQAVSWFNKSYRQVPRLSQFFKALLHHGRATCPTYLYLTKIPRLNSNMNSTSSNFPFFRLMMEHKFTWNFSAFFSNDLHAWWASCTGGFTRKNRGRAPRNTIFSLRVNTVFWRYKYFIPSAYNVSFILEERENSLLPPHTLSREQITW